MLADRVARERAAADLDVNFAVTAGAGSGKTSLLVERILHHVLERGTPLERIAAITFTRKAAAEMRERLEDALERAAELLETDLAADLDPTSEGDRVAARLPGAARGTALERARDALDHLDEAQIGTIHSLAGSILRRHHELAGVDASFQVDEDGTAADELFRKVWRDFLRTSAREPDGAASWRRALAKLSLPSIEAACRRLASFHFPAGLLASESCEVQRYHARCLAGELEEELRAIGDRVLSVGGVNRNLRKHLATAAALAAELLEGRLAPERLDASGLPKSCPSLGTRVELPASEAARLRRRLGGALECLRKAAAADEGAAAALAAIAGPFIERFRAEFLRSGWISHDGLIVLCRDILRDRVDARRQEGERFDHILVDEFQDTDPLQYEIAFFLAEDATAPPCTEAFAARLAPGKLFIVGDAKQSIYRFRGADIEAYRRAVETIVRERGEVLELSTNFRSLPDVLEPLNDLFAGCFAAAGGGRKPSLDPAFEPLVPFRREVGSPAIEIWSVGERGARAKARRGAEAEAVAAWLRERIDSGELRAADIAILFRALTEVDPFLRSLRRRQVPYVLESGKGFYTRYEVELLLSLLRLVSTPADPAALIACLRSPLCGVPDRELHLHARQVADPSARWSIWNDPSEALCPRLSRAFAFLRSFVRQHAAARLDETARAALDETPLRTVMAASHEGAQKVANLEKAVRRIAELSRAGLLARDEILERLAREEGRDKEEGDSPLADESFDAVSVLTVHKAKGLEWPVVILPDLARSTRAAGHPIAIATARPGALPLPAPSRGIALALRAGEVWNPAYLRHRMLEDAHERAETRRLLYVASTRARDRLVLVSGVPEGGDLPWLEPLSAWGYALDGGLPPPGPLHQERIIHRRIESVPEARRRARKARFDPVLRAAVERFESAMGRVRDDGARAPRLRAASATDAAQPEDAVRRAGGAALDGLPQRAARAAGSALHHLLEVWDRQDPSWLIARAPDAAAVAAAREGADPRLVRDEVLARLQRALERGGLRELQGLPAIARELPVLYASEDGTVWDGVMDLVTGTLDAPEVIDFKTDRGEDLEALERKYEAQLARYAEGLGRALGLASTPPARIWPLAHPEDAR